MTTTPLPAPRRHPDDSINPASPSAHRWRLHRAGIVNVWYYFDQRFDLSGGRLVLRGTNGSGKSRALEMLLPFLLDADRRRMDATGSGKVRLEDLMRAGGEDQPNRLGYLWIELVRTPPGSEEAALDTQQREYLTVGALIRFSHSTSEAKAWYFTTPLRVDHDLRLMDDSRAPLSREDLTAAIGAERITQSPETHRDQVRSQVFGLVGEAGRQRYAGLLQLLHTLRSPDVGNRIDEGRLPQILSDALPPLSEHALLAAGEELDGLEETRAALERLENAYGHVADFLKVYSRYATGVLASSAQGALTAAHTAQEAQRLQREQAAAHQNLVQQHAAAAAALEETETYVKELTATATGIKDSQEYRDARELTERLGRLTALASAADSVLELAAAARREETGAVAACDAAAQEVCDTTESVDGLLGRARDQVRASGLSVRLAERIAARVQPVVHPEEPVRTHRDDDPAAVRRPLPAQLQPSPEQLEEQAKYLRQAALDAADAATARHAQAEARRGDAARLAADFLQVRRAEERAEDCAQDAAGLEEEAAATADDRDACAISLASAWREWITSAGSATHLAHVAWDGTAAAGLLLDAHSLAGEQPPAADDLAGLDALPRAVAADAYAAHAAALAELDTAERLDREVRTRLEGEAADLRAERDVEPAAPAWTGPPPPGAVALWRALEFRPDLSEEDRAGLEAAMLASGLLTAHITAEGLIAAASGQLLLAADGPVTLRSARQVLTAVEDSGVPAARIQAVLERIALDTPGHPTWIHRDGSFGIGALHGRHALPRARYIGASARAAARAERLEQIAQELRLLEESAEARSRARDTVKETRRALDAHLAAAPRSSELAALRQQAVRARRQASDKRRQAADLARSASEARLAWSVAERAHRDRCAAFGLPDSAEDLGAIRDAAGRAEADCRELARACSSINGRLERLADAGTVLEEQRARRRSTEDKAGLQWTLWATEAAELAALQESMGSSLEQLHARLAEVEQALKRAEQERTAIGRAVNDLAGQVGRTEIKAQDAEAAATAARTALGQASAILARRATHPALALAAADANAPAVRESEDPAAVKTAAHAVLAALAKPDAQADVTTLLRAQSTLERNIMGNYDVLAAVEDGIHTVELADAEGRRYIADAAAHLKARRDSGRAALTGRERAAFQHFVLGGLAEELRVRIGQAVTLVAAMNASLQTVTTSHGIGVRLRWQLTEPTGSPIARIKQLIALDGRVMRQDQADELIALIKARVDENFAADPQAGYAAHLRRTLDYRTWHTMEAVILGPETGQERKLSRRAKLSQGEIRFVSYVTLFAATDAYLSGLPEPQRALRLILLDDAFAKVDNRTIGELMGLLVTLDLDFVMTGHALWGCFPQVPALDAYEVRRAEGTAAITTHVHWDGHTRHLRLAP